MLPTAQASYAGELFPKVVVTVPAVTPYVNTLLDGITQAQDLLRPGQDAHSFSLNSRQRDMLHQADVIILADRSMTPFLDKLLATEAKRGATIVALSDLKEAEALPYISDNPWLSVAKAKAGVGESHEEDEEKPQPRDGKAATDPHVWLDPVRMAALAHPLAEAIAQRSPTHRVQLLQNAEREAEHLRQEVDPALGALLIPRTTKDRTDEKPVIPFITYHAAYQYFMARYRLKNGGDITQRPEEYFGARDLRNRIARAAQLSIRCVISESASPLVQRIAKASGARVITLSPETPVTPTDITSAPWAQNDYDRLLQKTAESFGECL